MGSHAAMMKELQNLESIHELAAQNMKKALKQAASQALQNLQCGNQTNKAKQLDVSVSQMLVAELDAIIANDPMPKPPLDMGMLLEDHEGTKKFMKSMQANAVKNQNLLETKRKQEVEKLKILSKIQSPSCGKRKSCCPD